MIKLASALKHVNGDKLGSYQIATRTEKTVVNPGDTIVVEQYITGYGRATSLKMVHYPSSDIYDFENSFVEWGISAPDKENIQRWGGRVDPLQPDGVTLYLGDFEDNGWTQPSAFFDDGSMNTTMISAEKKYGDNAPYKYTFKLMKNAPPGQHKLHFYMTYFNGETWQCSAIEVEFKINNSFEKYNTLISSLAIAALAITIIKDGAAPVINHIMQLFK